MWQHEACNDKNKCVNPHTYKHSQTVCSLLFACSYLVYAYTGITSCLPLHVAMLVVTLTCVNRYTCAILCCVNNYSLLSVMCLFRCWSHCACWLILTLLLACEAMVWPNITPTIWATIPSWRFTRKQFFKCHLEYTTTNRVSGQTELAEGRGEPPPDPTPNKVEKTWSYAHYRDQTQPTRFQKSLALRVGGRFRVAELGYNVLLFCFCFVFLRN